MHWTSNLRTPFKYNAKKGGLDSCTWLGTSLYACFSRFLLCCTLALLSRRQQDSMQSWTSAWACQSMQTVFRYSSAPLLLAAFAIRSSFSQWPEIPCELQILGFLTGILKWFVSCRNKQPVRASFVCIEVLTQPTSSSLFLSLEERIDRIQKCRRVTENTPILPTEVLFAATSDCHPRHPTKDGRVTDSCFALIA